MSQPFARLEETEDEDSVRILDAAAAGGKSRTPMTSGPHWAGGPAWRKSKTATRSPWWSSPSAVG